MVSEECINEGDMLKTLPWYTDKTMWLNLTAITVIFHPLFFFFLLILTLNIDFGSLIVILYEWMDLLLILIYGSTHFICTTLYLLYNRYRYSKRFEYPKGLFPLLARAICVTFIIIFIGIFILYLQEFLEVEI